MASSVTTTTEASPIVACTISRDIQNFDLLIEDMEAALGDGWGDLGFSEALAFLGQPEAEELEFVAIAIDESDEDDLAVLMDLITAAKGKSVKVILIAEDVSTAALHQLLRNGADEFVPYPLPENELEAAISRLRKPAAPDPAAVQAAQTVNPLAKGARRDGAIIAVHGLAGGVGATTFAVNLAWELANISKEQQPRICLLDLDLQFGTAATYLDLPRRDAVFEMLSDTESTDDESFGQALLSYEEKLQVLTAPADVLPLDFLGPQDVERLLSLASNHFDYVIVDMPTTVVQWTETVLNAAHIYFALIELDMRSAQNALRLKRALQSEDLPFEKLRFALNRAPRFTDLNGKSRVKRMAESLGISIDLLLPDGGKQVTQGGDHGLPLATSAAKNPLRKELNRLARQLNELGQSEGQAA